MSFRSNFIDSVRFRAREDLVVEEIDQELVVLDLEADTYYGFNAVAATVLEILVEPHSIGELVEKVCARYDVTTDVARRDVEGLVRALVEARLVEEISR